MEIKVVTPLHCLPGPRVRSSLEIFYGESAGNVRDDKIVIHGKLKAHWRGELDLREAFRTLAVLNGLAINVATTMMFLILITLDQLWLALIPGKGTSLPYNIIVVVGVWQSADRYGGPRHHRELARILSVLLFILLSLTGPTCFAGECASRLTGILRGA